MSVTAQFTSGVDLRAASLNQSSIAVVTATSDITLPFTGMLIFNTTDNTMYRYTGSVWVPFSGSGIALQATDQTRTSSTTFLSSTDLVLPVGANVNYIFESQLITDSNTTADVKFNFLIPSGAALRFSTWCSGPSDSATQTAIFHDAIDLTSFNASGAGSGTMLASRPGGRLAMGSTSGNFTVQFAQNTSNSTGTILKAGSWIRLSRV